MLNVLQLIPTLDRSGAEKQMVLLAKGLPKDRFRVEAAALTRLGPLEADLRASGVPVTRIGKPLKVDPFALARLTKFLKRKQFDVVQTWVFAANAYGRVAAHLAKTPVVVTAEMAVDLWKSPHHLAIDRRLAPWCDRIVGNSRAVVDFYRDAGLPPHKLDLIYSGIDAEEPPAIDRSAMLRTLGWADDSTVLLFAGRLMPQKGVADLIAALDVLQHIRPKLKALIVGDGPLRSDLEETAHAYHLDDSVKFIGQRHDVPRLLAFADFLVLPSLYEGLPNVVLEAMRFRKPVVATSAPGTTEAVTHDETGLLVPVHDTVSLARAIRALADDPALRLRMGNAGRERVERDFAVTLMVDRFAALYEKLAKEKGLTV